MRIFRELILPPHTYIDPSREVAQPAIYDVRRNLPARRGESHSRLSIGGTSFFPILRGADDSEKPEIFGVFVDYESLTVEFYDPHGPRTDAKKRSREAYVCEETHEIHGKGVFTYCYGLPTFPPAPFQAIP